MHFPPIFKTLPELQSSTHTYYYQYTITAVVAVKNEGTRLVGIPPADTADRVITLRLGLVK